VSLAITSPTQGQILNGSINAEGVAEGRQGEPGRATEITYSDFELLFNGVLYTASDVSVVQHGFEYSWSLAAVINVAGSVTITIRAKQTDTKMDRDGNSASITRTVTASVVVQVDLTAPTVTIIAPAGEPVRISLPETGLDLPVSVRAQDAVGIASVEASVDNPQSYKPLIRDAVDASLWNNDPAHPLIIPGSPLPAGVRKLFARARDTAGNFSETSRDFIAVDDTAPASVILGPNAGKKIPWSAPQTVIEVNGTATDMQSGVASVTCKLLNKTGSQLSSQVKTFPPAGPGLVSWTMTFPITSPGWYSLLCEFRDHGGQLSTQVIGNLEVAESFSPADINDLLGSRQYLEDLLKFFKDHFKRADGANVHDITADDLMQVFHQEFERLAKQTDATTAQRPVNQVRLCVEVLRKFLSDLNAAQRLEPEYTLLAYETLLRQMGTSYEEVRLAHGAEPAQRRALAERLGIDLNPQWSDYLDRLLLQPEEITEAKLESLFGLMDTTQDPFGSRSSRQLFDWQAFQLHAMWVNQDRGLQEPIIDPDVIGKSDLAKIEPTDPAFALWNARSTQIKQHFQTVETNRRNQATALAGLKKIVDDALLGIINDPATPTNLVACDDSGGNPLAPLDFLICLDALHKNGKDIEPVLEALHLDLSALRYLLRIHGLAKLVTGTVTEAEWESVYHILTRVWKGSQRKSWRAAEAGLAISPQFFRLYRDELPRLPSTGTADGALLANGVDDPNWILTAAPGETPTGKVFVTQQQPGTWLANNDRSHWISPNKNASAGNAPGVYVYKTKFDLSGWDLATVQMLAAVAVDDVLLDVKLNGTSLGLTAVGFSTFTNLSLSGGFQDGENTVEFVVSNSLSTNNPTGLRVELSFATPPRRVQLPRWRRPEDARREWQSILRARIDQEDGLRQGFDTAIQATEEVALPVLRDSLINVIGVTKGMPLNLTAEWLSERFFIETQGSGWRLTTRVLQAIETMQSLIFSLRTQRLADDHPADSWSLPEASSQFDTQEEFDQEWSWAGSYEAWRGAMLVFYYPENILLPSLRDASDMTQPFKKLLQSLRAKSRLSPVAARALASEYLDEARAAAGPVLPATFILTDERTEAQLIELGVLGESLLNPFNHATQPTRREIFYFVPMALALQLQRSGEYTAALDWFQTVYAYNLPRAQRKIYPGLKQEVNGTPVLSRTEHWLRDFLNPHDLAEVRSSRSNPYTRFTLMSLARCFLEFADAEFTNDTGDSLARARSLYLSARNLLAEPDFDQIQPENENETLLPNPVLSALRKRIENQLAKLHQGRNISGMKREIEIPTPPKTIVGLPTVGTGGQLVIPGSRPRQKPTPYRFSVLMERAKQLVGIAQQIEAAYLAALEKRDAENYNLKKAGFDLQLAEAGNKLQELRELEAINGEALAARQRSRATKQKDTYRKWLNEPSLSERLVIENHKAASVAQQLAATFAAGITVSQAITTAATATTGAVAAGLGAAAVSGFAVLKAGADVAAIKAQTAAQIFSIQASHERRANDWQFGYDLADIDEQIADQQAAIATDHRNIVVQEKTIAQAQTTEARAMVDYLAHKFTSAELYEWMSGVLGGVYSYFLQQATSVAMLAETQLTFERQETPTSFIQNDYWELPSETSADNATDKPKDRRGLTGSARLLQDIHQLDQYAFETNKRKLNLAHTISLAALDAFAFAVFRNTGVLNFNTPMRLFDEAFPGHYLRLIKRVRTSVVALIPPVLGIRATLMASGISRVIVGGDVFQETTIRRDPELVALSSPANGTGVFELDVQSELLMPFESMGVATGWEFSMPRASNPFDFGTIADVLITIEYTALSNDDYRRQVIQELDPLVSADKAYSIRNDFPDVWYDLRNGEANTAQIKFRSERTHFPPNLDDHITILELLFAVIPTDENTEITGDVTMTYTPDIPVGSQVVTGKAALTDLRVQTRLPAGRSAWGGVQGKRATGKWQFDLPADLITKLRNDAIDDVLVVATFAGAKPTWPT